MALYKIQGLQRNLVFVAITFPAIAHARGGPEGVLVNFVEFFIMCAIFGGISTGLIFNRRDNHKDWEIIAIFYVLAVLAYFTVPILGAMLGIPALVFLTLFVSVKYICQDDLFQSWLEVKPKNYTKENELNSNTSVRRRILCWLAATYIFWSAFSLINLELFSFLAVPIIVIFDPNIVGKYLPFILLPLALAFAVGTIGSTIFLKVSKNKHIVAPFIFSACVLITFFISAEIYKTYLISNALANHKPENLRVSSFLSSILKYRTDHRLPHASFDENGKKYIWSYSERKFIKNRFPNQNQ
jgi:hypothetical protein